MSVTIMDFGKTNDGLFMYRVNGDRKEIDKYIEELKHLGCEFYDETEIEKSWKTSSVFLKIKFPPAIEEEMDKRKAEEDAQRKKTDAIRDAIRSKKEPIKGLED